MLYTLNCGCIVLKTVVSVNPTAQVPVPTYTSNVPVHVCHLAMVFCA